jgi:hypothetical protein
MTDVIDQAAGVVAELVPPPVRRHPLHGRNTALLRVAIGATTAATVVEVAEWPSLSEQERRGGVLRLCALAAATWCLVKALRCR